MTLIADFWTNREPSFDASALCEFLNQCGYLLRPWSTAKFGAAPKSIKVAVNSLAELHRGDRSL